MSSATAFVIGALVVAALCAARVYFLSFRAQANEEYEGLAPAIDIRKHLSGPIVCEGVIYGPTGRVSSRFVARMQGEWNGNSGVLREHFVYDNGDRQERAWLLELSDDGRIAARADDVVGVGRGKQSGPGVRLCYRIRLPEEAGGHVLDTTDWMYLVEDGKIINRSQFRKFGFKVAELVATIRQEKTA
jgi:hypothetical protein